MRPRARKCFGMAVLQGGTLLEGPENHVRQPVGTAWRNSRSPDAARRAHGGRRRCGVARSAPRAARGRRCARRRALVHRGGEEERGRRRGDQVGHAGADGRQARARPADRDARLECRSDRPQRARAGRHHDGRPAGLRQNHHHGQDRAAPDRAGQAQGADGLARHAPSGRDGAARGARPAGQRRHAADRRRPDAAADRAPRARSRPPRRLRRGDARYRGPHHARRRDDGGSRGREAGRGARTRCCWSPMR